MRNLKCLMILVSLLCGIFIPSICFAEPGDGGEERIIHRYHHYFIPYQPEAVNCFGVYRILSNYTHQQLGIDVGNKEHQRKDFAAGKIVNFTQKSAFYSSYSDITRGDLFILTDFAARAQRTDVHHQGNTVIYDHYTFYYETPMTVLGETVVTSPLFGAEAVDDQDRTLIVLDRDMMKKYIREISDADFVQILLPQFDGPNPRGTLIRSKWLSDTEEIGVFTLTKDHHVSVGWWDLFSQAILKHIDDIRRNPQKYFGNPSAEDLASLNTMKQFIEEQDKQYHVPPSASPIMNISWTDIKAFYIKDVLDDYIYKDLTSHYKGLGWLYKYKTFLRADEISDLWEAQAEKIADEVWAKAYIRQNETDKDKQFSIGRTFASYVPEKDMESEDEYRGGPLDITVDAPWGLDATDYLVPRHVGFWSAREPYNQYNFCDDFVFVNCDSNYLGRWLWQRAQLKLYEEGKSKWIVRSKNDGDAWATLAGGNPEKMYSILIDLKNKNKYNWTEPYSPMLKNEDSVWKAVYDMDREFWKQMFPYMSLKFHPVFASVFEEFSAPISWESALQRSYAPQVYSSWGDDFMTARPTITADAGKIKEIANSNISPLLGNDSMEYIADFQQGAKTINDGLASIKTTYKNKQRYSTASQVDVVSVPVHGEKAVEWLQNEWSLKDLFRQKIISLPDLNLHKTLWEHWPVGKDIKSGSGIPNW
ncbi:hypothetical protein [Thermovirga lienii]|uniref:hypothetical protein n=1 Tax=Thermovirga lienii TaxID=336261 RepID=UPI002FE27F12